MCRRKPGKRSSRERERRREPRAIAPALLGQTEGSLAARLGVHGWSESQVDKREASPLPRPVRLAGNRGITHALRSVSHEGGWLSNAPRFTCGRRVYESN